MKKLSQAFLPLLILTRVAIAIEVTFEELPNGGQPVDNSQLREPYKINDATSVQFYFDRDRDNEFDGFEPGGDLAPILEYSFDERGDRFQGFKGSEGFDTPDPGFEAQLGKVFLRQPPEDSFGERMFPLIVDYTTTQTITALSGEIWDIDGGGEGNESRYEEWQVEVLREDGEVLATLKDPPVGKRQSRSAPLDGRPWTFAFTDLPPLVDKVRITFNDDGKDGSIGLAFNNFSPFTAVPFFHMDPRSTYLHPRSSGTIKDFPTYPRSIRLIAESSSNGDQEKNHELPFEVKPGDLLKITRHGEFDYNVNDKIDAKIDGVWAVFTSDDTLRAGIQDAPQGTEPRLNDVPVTDGIFSSPSHVGDDWEEQIHDFSIDTADSPLGGTLVRVPENATHLFLSSEDSYWSDNEYPTKTRFGVTIENLGSQRRTGDLNHDFAIDASDVDLLIDAIVNGNNDSHFDLTDDHVVDRDDLFTWVHDLRNTHFGDANLDGVFNSSDLVEVFQGGKFERDLQAGWSEGDWNGNQRFETNDLVVAFQNGGYISSSIATVPEPASLMLLLVGTLFLRVRRKKSVN